MSHENNKIKTNDDTKSPPPPPPPFPSSMPMPSFRFDANSNEGNDLLKRIGDFLPKIAQANQDLENQPIPSVRIDASLTKDDKEDDDDDDDDDSMSSDDSSSSDDNDEDTKKQQNKPSEANETQQQQQQPQTIELRVALGDFDNNPVIPLLESGNDNNDTNNSTKDKYENGIVLPNGTVLTAPFTKNEQNDNDDSDDDDDDDENMEKNENVERLEVGSRESLVSKLFTEKISKERNKNGGKKDGNKKKEKKKILIEEIS